MNKDWAPGKWMKIYGQSGKVPIKKARQTAALSDGTKSFKKKKESGIKTNGVLRKHM